MKTTKKELYEIAKVLKLKNRSKMDFDELYEKIISNRKTLDFEIKKEDLDEIARKYNIDLNKTRSQILNLVVPRMLISNIKPVEKTTVSPKKVRISSIKKSSLSPPKKINRELTPHPKKERVYSTPIFKNNHLTMINDRQFIDDFSLKDLRDVAKLLKIDFYEEMSKAELYNILIGPDLDYMSNQQLEELSLKWGLYSFRESREKIINKLARRIERELANISKLSSDELIELLNKFGATHYENASRDHIIFKIIKKSLLDVPIHSLKYKNLNIPYTELTFYNKEHPPYKIRQVINLLDRIQREHPTTSFTLDESLLENPLFNKIKYRELKNINLNFVKNEKKINSTNFKNVHTY